MCIAFVYIAEDNSGPYRAIVVHNRDEVFQRPTQPAAWWPVRGRSAKWFGCRDGVAGGTWLGISPFGRVGIVTNYRKAHAAIAKGSQQQKSPSNGSYSVALYVSAALFAVAAVATGFFANSHAGLSNAWFAIAATSSLVLAITTVRLQRAMSSPLPQHKTLQGPATPPSRGKLVLQYLTREPNFAPSSASSTTLPTVSNADDFASELEQANLDCYNGFNAIFGDESNKWYYANHSEGDREKIVRPLSAGLHVVSNGWLDADPQWFKSVHGRKIFHDCLKANGVLHDIPAETSTSTLSSVEASSTDTTEGGLTGHEHEDTIFCSRTRMHRFFTANEYGTVTRSNMWQDMGVGEVCLFRNRKDLESARVVFRDAAGKVRANFSLSGILVQTAENKPTRVLFSNATSHNEKKEIEAQSLSFRFKTELIASTFFRLCSGGKSVVDATPVPRQNSSDPEPVQNSLPEAETIRRVKAVDDDVVAISLLNMLSDESRPQDFPPDTYHYAKPDTGYPDDVEEVLSTIHIPPYTDDRIPGGAEGSRSRIVVLLRHDGSVVYYDQHREAEGRGYAWGKVQGPVLVVPSPRRD